MAQTLALIHTSPILTPVFSALCEEHLPGVKTFHMVDESLIKDTIREGRLRRVTVRRLLMMIESASLSRADAVLVTCSSLGPGVAIGQQIFDLPVIRVDDAMAAAAIARGRRIGVMATLPTTLDPTIALLRQKAAEAGREIEIVSSLCDGAFAAALARDAQTHDRILREALLRDMRGVDVIVLAQASMAGVVNTLPPGALQAPVLSSPELGVRQAREILARQQPG